MNPGARYPPGPVLERLTAPTTGVRHALHRVSAVTEQLTDEVLDLALEPLWVLYLQTHMPPAGTSNRLGCLGLQRRIEAAHPGAVAKQWLTLHNRSTAQGKWYVHQLLFLPRTAPEHRRQNAYHTHPERLGAQSFLQPSAPAVPPGQSPEALQQGPPLDTATRYSKGEAKMRTGPSRTARTAERWPGRRPAGTSPGTPWGLGHTGQRTARRWRPRSRPSPWDPWRRGQRSCCPTSPAETRGPASQRQRTRQRHPSRWSSCTSSRRRYWQTAGGALSTTTARSRSQGAYRGSSVTRPTRGTPHSASAPVSGMRVAAHRLPGPSRGKRWCCRRRANRPSCTATPEGTGRTSWLRAAGPSGTAPPRRGHSRSMSTGSRSPPRPTI